jgi:glycosyltransferase involved in cell wall biosynthesis
MKIAFVSDSIYPYNKGGKETRSYELAKQLVKEGDEVHFYTMKFWEGSEIIEKDGFFLHGICKKMPLYKNNKRDIGQGIRFGFASFKLLKEDFDVLDADHMVYFHLWPAKLACLIKKKPFVVTWHEVWGKNYWKEYMGKKGILGYWIEKLASKLPDKIIAVSEHTKEKLINELNVNSKKITVIPNAINIKEIDKIKQSKETSDVIFAGRLINHKNVDVLINAMSIGSLKDKKLIIIGDGPEMQNLELLTKQLNLAKNVVFKGFVEKTEEVISLMKSSKVFVLPSTREGFGISVIEANACGIPVITVNHKDNASRFLIQESKNGFVTSLDKKDIADTITEAIKQHSKMSAKCLSSAKQYDWSNIIEMFLGVYGK